MNSPFESFVNTIYDKRKDAKRTGNDAMAYVYKILMNSLYGRFGINPKCTITEVCDLDRYNLLTKISDYIFADKLSEHYYIVTYWSNTGQVSDSDWCPPRISAVQLAAAVTACARIHMYPYISRPDSYYTDTDSVVLGSPLPEEDVSSTELGKFKLEYYALEERMEDTLNRTSTQYLVESKAPAQAVQSKKEMSAFVLAQAKAQSANSSRKSSSGDPVTDRKKS
ncbi:DNA polymerase-like [Prosopis cineraria]|nr:DNA polymerase-like [Prosopis cineraria]